MHIAGWRRRFPRHLNVASRIRWLLALQFRYPPEWHLQPFDESVGHVGFVGVVVSNVDRNLEHPQYPNGETTGWDMRGFPSDGLTISLEYAADVTRMRGRADTLLPLSLAGGKPVRHRIPAGSGTEMWLPFDHAGGAWGCGCGTGPT
jgi:hypothetical protein